MEKRYLNKQPYFYQLDKDSCGPIALLNALIREDPNTNKKYPSLRETRRILETSKYHDGTAIFSIDRCLTNYFPKVRRVSNRQLKTILDFHGRAIVLYAINDWAHYIYLEKRESHYYLFNDRNPVVYYKNYDRLEQYLSTQTKDLRGIYNNYPHVWSLD